MAGQFPHLFSSIKIRNMTVRNRIVNTAHGTNFASDRLVTDQHIYYHVERAKGGVRMRISGDEFVSGGLTLDDMQEITPKLAATGQIDYFNVSNSTYSDLKSMSAHIP